jgi:hypothetical protein
MFLYLNNVTMSWQSKPLLSYSQLTYELVTNSLHRPIANPSHFQGHMSSAGIKIFNILPCGLTNLMNEMAHFKAEYPLGDGLKSHLYLLMA